jgi:putative modified peptide
MTGPKQTAPIDAAIAERLLELLSSDDAFREQFQADPIAALQSIGYGSADMAVKSTSRDLADPFSACSVVQLASKEQILEAKAELKATMVQGLAYNTPTFEAATLARRDLK